MAKRFTETTKWQDSWFRKLKAEYKLFWFYILDNCDNAGLWEYDLEVASFFVGKSLNELDVKTVFSERIIEIEGKWFIPKFIEFQYGELNENSIPHKSVINKLKKYNLIDNNMNLLIPLAKGLQTLKDKDKEQDKDKDKVKEKAKEQRPILFRDCIFFEKDKFIQEFENEDYKIFDANYYYESAKNWSEEGNKKKNWIATTRNWALRDLKDGKPKLKKQYEQQFNESKGSRLFDNIEKVREFFRNKEIGN
jgi:hypothetical protein